MKQTKVKSSRQDSNFEAVRSRFTAEQFCNHNAIDF